MQSILSQDPTKTNAEPMIIHVLSPYLSKMKITIKFPGINAIRKSNVWIYTHIESISYISAIYSDTGLKPTMRNPVIDILRANKVS